MATKSYDFSEFETERFQQLVQELAIKVLGPKVVAYGPGRDGGRDFSWDGALKKYDWDGYGIGQVKFKRNKEGSGIDGKWVLKQLKGDLAKLNTKPKYYILATNVELTPVPNTGSWDRVDALLKSAGFAGHAVWDGVQLRALLNQSRENVAVYDRWFARKTQHGVLLCPVNSALDEYRREAQRLIDHSGFRIVTELNHADIVIAFSAHWYLPETVQACQEAKKLGKSVFVCAAGDSWPDELTEFSRVTRAMRQDSDFAAVQTEVTTNREKLKQWLAAFPPCITFDTKEQLIDDLRAALNGWRPPDGGPPPPIDNTAPYLDWIRRKFGHLEIRGLIVGTEKVHKFPIDDIYIPLTTASTPDKSPEAPTRASHMPLEEALQAPLLVIAGAAGSGKTTFLSRVAFELAGGKVAKPLALDPWFPLLVRIGDLEAHIDTCRKRDQRDAPTRLQAPTWLEHFLSHRSEELNWGLTREFFHRKLCEDRTLLLIDGLDEATSTKRREQFAQMFREVCEAYPRCRIVVTTRPGAYQGDAVLAEFRRVNVDSLDTDAVTGFLEHWSKGVYPNDVQGANEHCRELQAALAARPEIADMVRTPVMLTALAVVHYNERRLPEGRAELYESILRWLAKAREGEGRRGWKECLDLMGSLALAMQTRRGGRVIQVARGVAADWLASSVRGGRASALDFLTREEVDSGILTSVGTSLKFWHLTFQEYLAARVIAGLEDSNQHNLILEDDRLYHSEWREVMRLLGGCLYGQGVQKVEALFRAVLDTTKGADLKRNAQCASLLDAIHRDLRLQKYTPADPRYDEVLRSLSKIFEGAPGLTVQLRAEAADAIGLVDSRFEHENWIEIPAGTFWMGAQKHKGRNRDHGAYDNESPVHEVKLNAFRLAKYPVTVREYGKYLEANPEQKKPHDWPEQTKHPTRPVVNVSWYDAEAYCKWKGKGCRLPTEAEWERAARGPKALIYPWGNDPPTPEFANYEETGIGSPTPVGLFPGGTTAEGALDMAGNVWEWVADWYAEYPEEAQENPIGPGEGESKVLRGGSFVYLSGVLRSAYRFDGLPVVGFVYIGFRCAWE